MNQNKFQFFYCFLQIQIEKIKYPFLIKCNYLNSDFYLNGRFDAVKKEEDKIIIYEGGKVEIIFQFADEFKKIKEIIDFELSESL